MASAIFCPNQLHVSSGIRVWRLVLVANELSNEAQRTDPESLTSPSEANKETGSQVEGFCIPQFLVRKSDIDRVKAFDIQEHWHPDRDIMKATESFIENAEKKSIPIFIAEHAEDDPRYVKAEVDRMVEGVSSALFIRMFSIFIIRIWFLQQIIPCVAVNRRLLMAKSEWSYTIHDPVRKLQSNGFPAFDRDEIDTFKYPIAWPEPAMEWLVRPRPSGWPSAELVQEIFDSGCQLAPVGRGKRLDEPIDVLVYCKNPELSVPSSAMADPKKKWAMNAQNGEHHFHWQKTSLERVFHTCNDTLWYC